MNHRGTLQLRIPGGVPFFQDLALHLPVLNQGKKISCTAQHDEQKDQFINNNDSVPINMPVKVSRSQTDLCAMLSKSSAEVINLLDSFLLGRVTMCAAQLVHYKWDDGWMCTAGVQQLFCGSGWQTPSSTTPPAAMVNEVKCDPIRCEMCQFGFI